MPHFRPFGPTALAAALLVPVAGCTSAADGAEPHPHAGARPEGTAGAGAGSEGEDGGGSGAGGGKADSGEDGGSGGGDGGDGPLSGFTVVIDPGHNGGNADAAEEISRMVPAGPNDKECDTVGAEGASGYEEHAFTLDFSLHMRDELEERGAEVVLTREDDDGVGPCIDERAEIGNEAGADAAVSVHADGGPESGRGFHVIAPGELDGFTDDIAAPSMRLAEELRDTFEADSGVPTADYIAEDGLDERTDLGGLNMSDVPKVFLEAGNMRNPDDAELLEDAQWRKDAAAVAADAVASFLLAEKG
ncbi:N-acetylmuramoyl-L-alanine amidase [Nocardiopsis sp. RSe5-2]|uniref:N-acetylmuramoyl-L-alanine amidase n=1 Tax=Nocardiopsis endophytica TaxID=3018445 RepID=A0ABT4UC69_9ACTN|nr:N-acetylmuramoyl-L-alanine amidase [Nocardiopsis endophytica]MDA2814577.1 N-acetylmuramoyl-L-alanine amidase [Nocardiopsis endophytica]